MVAVYVDDILISGKIRSAIEHLKTQLQDRFQMIDLGPAHMYLGIRITRDCVHRTITLDQEKYFQFILKRFNMQDCHTVKTPMEPGLKLCKREDTASPADIKEFQRLIGCLEFAACATRPDTTFAVHTLAQYSTNPDSSNFNASK